MGWDKDSTANKAKAVCASRAKPGIQLYFSIGRQMSSLTQENRNHHAVFFWNDKCWHFKCSPSSFFAPAFIVEYNAMWYGTSLWPVCDSVCLSHLLVLTLGTDQIIPWKSEEQKTVGSVCAVDLQTLVDSSKSLSVLWQKLIYSLYL